MNIEAEVRSFITEDQYNNLLTFFKGNAELLKEAYQETYYFDCPEDLRIQRNEYFSKIWLKKGKLHDDSREEIEVKADKDAFGELEKLFLSLGHGVEIKWFRKRFQFDWGGINVSLDHTRGYGYILELEKMCSEEDKDRTVAELKDRLASLNVELTPKEVFDERYKEYKENWRELTKDA